MSELNHPLFGKLTLEDDCVWSGSFRLPALAACQRRDYPPSKPTDEVSLQIEVMDGRPPSSEQEAAIVELRGNEEAILREYTERQFFACLDIGDFWKLEPNGKRRGFLRRLKKPDDLRQAMKVNTVTIESESRSGSALVKLWFSV